MAELLRYEGRDREIVNQSKEAKLVTSVEKEKRQWRAESTG